MGNVNRLFLLVLAIVLAMMLGCREKTTEPKMVAMPVLDLSGGSYETCQNVVISCSTPDANIRYTLDGSDPTASSTAYTEPLFILATTTIKAKGFKDGWIPSATASATYAIELAPVQMIHVPGGSFTMGYTREVPWNNELPTHPVTLNPFYIGKYEVTQAEWESIMLANPAQEYGLGDDFPVYYVSWFDALVYCNLRSMAEGFTPVYSIAGSTDPAVWGVVPNYEVNSTWDAVICDWNANGYRLPTEAEWEYAARGATNDPDYLYSGSEDFNAVAWFVVNADNSSHPVGTKAPNGIGTHDMSGNVDEWCWDRYGYAYYSSSPVDNPTGPAGGSDRVMRGGGWYSDASPIRVARRSSGTPSAREYCCSFRLCRSGS